MCHSPKSLTGSSWNQDTWSPKTLKTYREIKKKQLISSPLLLFNTGTTTWLLKTLKTKLVSITFLKRKNSNFAIDPLKLVLLESDMMFSAISLPLMTFVQNIPLIMTVSSLGAAPKLPISTLPTKCTLSSFSILSGVIKICVLFVVPKATGVRQNMPLMLFSNVGYSRTQILSLRPRWPWTLLSTLIPQRGHTQHINCLYNMFQ